LQETVALAGANKKKLSTFVVDIITVHVEALFEKAIAQILVC
jgi:hypothetical protein